MYYVWCALIKLARDIVLLLYVVVRDCLSLLICHDPEHLSLLQYITGTSTAVYGIRRHRLESVCMP